MAESGVILPVDSSGKALRSETVTTTFTTGSGGVVHQQVVTLADSTGVLLGTTAAPLPVQAPATLVSGSITAIDAVVGTTSGGAIVSGTSTAGSYVAIACIGQETSWSAAITGGSGYVLWFEGSLDSTNGINGSWFAIFGRQPVGGAGGVTTNTTTGGLFRGSAADMSYVRVRALTSITGTIAVTLRVAAGVDSISLGAPIPSGTQSIGTVQQAALTKGTQGATGVSTQDLKDSGRAPVTYYTAIPVLTTATDTLQSLTGTKGGVTVTATTTPAVVTTGKTLRVQKILASYVSTATSGYAMVRLRYNSNGTVVIASPVVCSAAVGNATPGTANAVGIVEVPIPDGLEFAAGAGVGISVQGFAAVTATAVGYCNVTLIGYEY